MVYVETRVTAFRQTRVSGRRMGSRMYFGKVGGQNCKTTMKAMSRFMNKLVNRDVSFMRTQKIFFQLTEVVSELK